MKTKKIKPAPTPVLTAAEQAAAKAEQDRRWLTLQCDRLICHAGDAREAARAQLAKMTNEAAIRPGNLAYNLSWGERLFSLAADEEQSHRAALLAVERFTKEIADGADEWTARRRALRVVAKQFTDEVVYGARNPSRSTSGSHNMMAEYTLQAMAQIVDHYLSVEE